MPPTCKSQTRRDSPAGCTQHPAYSWFLGSSPCYTSVVLSGLFLCDNGRDFPTALLQQITTILLLPATLLCWHTPGWATTTRTRGDAGPMTMCRHAQARLHKKKSIVWIYLSSHGWSHHLTLFRVFVAMSSCSQRNHAVRGPTGPMSTWWHGHGSWMMMPNNNMSHYWIQAYCWVPGVIHSYTQPHLTPSFIALCSQLSYVALACLVYQISASTELHANDSQVSVTRYGTDLCWVRGSNPLSLSLQKGIV